jgi:peptidoglycan/xylan/chitin deacetylase (PgdA/CDA1 family)
MVFWALCTWGFKKTNGLISRILYWLRHRRQKVEQQRLLGGRPALKILLFHGLYDDALGPCPPGIDKSLTCGLSTLERCLEETRKQGFSFIHANEMPKTLKSRKRLALLTFDDGYANNRLMLPILNRLQVPALLFVTTDAMLRRRLYWWDVLAREAMQRGISTDQLSRMRLHIKSLKPADIERQIETVFGEGCYQPRGDHDRPMTPEELKKFASDSLIVIGNHTHRHALLSQLNSDEIEDELHVCQNHLREITGINPQTLAYPNGRWNTKVANIAGKMGIQYAFTTERLISPLPVHAERWMSLPRLQP